MGWFSKSTDGFFLSTITPAGIELSQYLGVVNGEAIIGANIFRDMFSSVRAKILAAFGRVFTSMHSSEPIPEMWNKDVMRGAWAEIGASTERYYQPGKFTTFHGYEYTSGPDEQNLHRIVLFRGSQVPDLPFGTMNSPNPEKLWEWLDGLRGKGIVAHGGTGDHLVELQVVLPPAPDDDFVKAVTDWEAKHPYNPRAGLGEQS